MRLSASLAAAALLRGLTALPFQAKADYTFSGSGSSGTLVGAGEIWTFNADGGAAFIGYLNDWSSPGVDAGNATYGETADAFGLDLTFTGGGTIDATSISIGNSSDCVGGTSGGTTFCTSGPSDAWVATQTGPDSISFLAQNASDYLVQGQDYFVNIFFDGATPTGLTGSWLTESTSTVPVPEPGTIALLGSGVAALATFGFAAKRRSR